MVRRGVKQKIDTVEIDDSKGYREQRRLTGGTGETIGEAQEMEKGRKRIDPERTVLCGYSYSINGGQSERGQGEANKVTDGCSKGRVRKRNEAI